MKPLLLTYDRYDDAGLGTLELLRVTVCPLCQTALNLFEKGRTTSLSRSLRACPGCGWWSYDYSHMDLVEGEFSDYFNAVAHLSDFAVDDSDTPQDLLLANLVRRPELVSNIHHSAFEDLVAGIYAEVYGYELVMTKRTWDEGIDIYLFNAGDQVAAVEVKQTKDPSKPVGIAALQRLVGAAFAREISEVHLVVSSRVTNSVRDEATLLGDRMKVELRDFGDIAAALDLLRPDSAAPPGSSESCPFWAGSDHPIYRGEMPGSRDPQWRR